MLCERLKLMATNLQVFCINKTNRYNPHERIQNIGGVNGGSRWKHTQQQAIAYIEAGVYQYYVSVGGATAWVIVAVHNGNKYLRTEGDSLLRDNLLSLPECPL